MRRDEVAQPDQIRKSRRAALNGQLYVAGGREQTLSKNLATFEVYDPATDTWGAGPEMPTARSGVAGAAFDGLFVVAGGERPGATHAEVEASTRRRGGG